MIPTTEPAQRIAIMFKRRLTTPWSEKEIRTYKILIKGGSMKPDELDLMERYYAFERRKGEKGIYRRDLQTFLNNYPSELDRAEQWDLKFRQMRQPKKVSKYDRDGNEPVSDDEWKRIGELAKEQLMEFKQRYGRI